MTFISRFFTILVVFVISTAGYAEAQFNAFTPAQSSNATPTFSTFNSATGSNFLPVEQAFVFDFSQQNDQLLISWQIAPEHYLYQEKFLFTGLDTSIGNINFPPAIPYQDEFFGEVNIYRDSVTITIPLIEAKAQGSLDIQYQGCSDAGFCYPPDTVNVPLDLVVNTHISDENKPELSLPAVSTPALSTSATSTPALSEATTSNSELSQDGQFSQKLTTNWWAPLLFLLLGIGLAFTPCVLPMYPILTSIVLGRSNLSVKQAGLLAFVYVQGMAITYTLLGLVVASLGVQFQALMQHPYLLVGISVMFVLLSLSMFGLYSLQLPSSIQTWLNERSQKQQGGRFGSVFIMGAISGLVCSPCVTAPLSGALLYVAQTGDLTTGAITLYLLALGMGIPLILVAMFGQKLLPKAGAWMNQVKVFFGFVLLTAPIFLLERLIDGQYILMLWSALGIVTFFWLFHSTKAFSNNNSNNQTSKSSWLHSVLQLISIVGFVVSLWLGLQGLQGNAYISFNGLTNNQRQEQQTQKIQFIRIKTPQDLEQQLALAKQQGKAVMFDYYADWCTACHEFEKYTFNDPDVAKQLNQMILLQADVTKADPHDVELMKHLNVFGLPTIEFWSAQGEYQAQARIAGFMNADAFANHLSSNNLSSNNLASNNLASNNLASSKLEPNQPPKITE